MKARILTTLAALLLALTSWAYGVEIDGIYYDLNNSTNTATVTYTGNTYTDTNPPSTAYTGNITIPASVTYSGTTYTVTYIGDFAFKNCTGLTSITIPSSVTYIGDFAFKNCTGLTSITIPSSVTSIEWYAFYGCTGLTNIYAEHTDPAAYNCSASAFYNVTATLHVPIGSKEAYANTEPWSKFKNIVEAAAQTARHPVQSRTHKQKGARKVGSNTKKSK